MTLVQLKYVIAVAGQNSLNDAAKVLFISQPSLSSAIHSLENEIGFDIFIRSKNGITLTTKGAEFIGYAKSVMEQYELLDAKYISQTEVKKTFSVSMQHYTFAVNAFVELVKQYGMDEYEFEVHETKTHEVIDNVKNRKSEIGILYLNDFNRNVLNKLFAEYELQFQPLLECGVYVYMWKGHPLAERKEIALEELDEYPCLGFAQGEHNSFYFAEEVLSTYQYKRFIRANDRATLLNLMVGLNGYTLCSGILCEDLNGKDYCAVKLKSDERMTIGYISRKDAPLSAIGQKYLEEIAKYKDKSLG
ncbi:LysR family transcriptional regulator [Dorea acetigenes]|uniref:LysR family transcriptional regulator n=1 Tax=Dorea acetigenes TaxID=2981787 RepID=A0ABT2RNI6_9FIRM|nr:LysR family transcriptional regulator [Dorea acetigenes]MCB6414606.1 LysR family transcriptional regulator [Faecalimonas umbilicata]MCU6686704.1 LysR family transcriptional regulator [Dorea acetigenes]SCJ07384.1 Morphology and auto-aggregation control protein [uncultured Clostridium sp.]